MLRKLLHLDTVSKVVNEGACYSIRLELKYFLVDQILLLFGGEKAVIINLFSYLFFCLLKVMEINLLKLIL